MGKVSMKWGGWHFTVAAIKTLQYEGLGTVCSWDSPEQWKHYILSPVAARAHVELEVPAEPSRGRGKVTPWSDVKTAPSPECNLGLSGFS